MEKEITGIQKGTGSYINEYMLSLTNSIKEELSKNFPPTNKEYYVYTRYNYKIRIMKIFVRLNAQSKINPRQIHIYFLFTINEKFPVSAPYVQCISDFSYPSLCDGRNLINCLIAEWKQSSTLTSIIHQLPSFINCFENDIKNKLLILYGNYIENDYTYSVNDFLSNGQNMFKSIQIMTTDAKGRTKYESRYLIITHLHLLILYPTSESDKTKSRLSFYAELRSVDRVNRLSIDDENLKEKAALKIVWKENAKKKLTNVLIVDQLENSEIINIISERKDKLNVQFKMFFNDDDNSVDQLSKMIDIKEAFLSQCYNDFCLKCVNEMYLKIIEIYSIQNDDNFKPFLERMHKLFVKYDQKDKK